MRKTLFFIMVIILLLIGLLVEKAEMYTNEVKMEKTLETVTETNSGKKISHRALQGCTLTGSDVISGKVSFKKHCKECGYTDTGSTTTYLTQDGQTYKQSFVCPNCKTEQELIIITSVGY